jgi:methylmalonyl-CoA/ethylmalonyl-CoA epimerase
MIGRLNHVGLAVPDLAVAVALYRDVLGAEVGPARDLPEHGVRVAFARLPNALVELMETLGDDGPLAAFLGRHPEGGMHHVCYEVPDLLAAAVRLKAAGLRPLGEPRPGAQGRPVLFLHPRDTAGCLIELEEA